jgi:hypothetical protein
VTRDSKSSAGCAHAASSPASHSTSAMPTLSLDPGLQFTACPVSARMQSSPRDRALAIAAARAFFVRVMVQESSACCVRAREPWEEASGRGRAPFVSCPSRVVVFPVLCGMLSMRVRTSVVMSIDARVRCDSGDCVRVRWAFAAASGGGQLPPCRSALCAAGWDCSSFHWPR